MELIIVERSFAEPVDMPALEARERRVAWCLQQHGVHALFSWVAKDGRCAVCFYDAPDAESVRVTQRTGELPFDHVWRAQELPVEPARSEPPLAGSAVVIVQRELSEPMGVSDVQALRARVASCHDAHRARLRTSYLQPGGRRMLCCFEAPDAESVRTAQRQSGVPMLRAWSAVRFGP